jgi:hypothetical protein
MVRIGRNRGSELFLRLGEVIRVPRNHPAVVEGVGAAGSAGGRRPLHGLGAHFLRFGKLLLIVVDGGEPVVRVG